MTAAEDAMKQINALLEEYGRVVQARGSDSFSSAVMTINTRFLAAVDRLTEPDGSYAREADHVRNATSTIKMDRLAALITALRDDIAAGYVESMIELAHADTHDSYLEMAEGLQGSGYKDAAAVIAGTSLEVHIRSLAGKNAVPPDDAAGRPKKTDTLNADLKKAGVYNLLEQKQVTAWLDLRNKAAHGEYGEYDHAAVKRLIEGVRDFAVRHPA